jgi:GT2 family glycosyltransferase
VSLQVVAVIVTRDRRSVAERAVAAVAAQEPAPAQVVVVDNASSDDTMERFAARSDITYVRSDDNGGYAAGLNLGLEAARRFGADAYWLLDDDSEPHAGALARLLEVADALAPAVGLVGLRGGMLRHGLVRHLAGDDLAGRPAPAPGARLVDFSLVDGALLLDAAHRSAGPLRGEFFMMFEDIEYSWRLGRGGYLVAVLDEELIDRGHLGSSGAANANPWRQYYLARNQLRWALESRSLRNVLGTLARQARFVAGDVRSPHLRRRRVAARLRGLADGVAGRMGRTVEPGAF